MHLSFPDRFTFFASGAHADAADTPLTNLHRVHSRHFKPINTKQSNLPLATMNLFCFNRNRKDKGNYKAVANKNGGARVVPPPPPGRPTVEDLISQVEFAQMRHKGVYTPKNGIRLVLPRDKKPYVYSGRSFHEQAPVVAKSTLR